MTTDGANPGESAVVSAETEESIGATVVACRSLVHEYSRGIDGSWVPWRSRPSAPTVTALRDVSLTVSRGETCGIAGPSGSGKSTLLHLVAGLLTPTEGTVRVAGTDLTELSDRARTRFRHRHVGLVFQRFHLLPSLSARANVALPLVQSGTGRRERRARASELLERIGLGDRTQHRPGELSGGERQRVAIARALVTEPDVVLADEPTGELDTDTGEQVIGLLTELATDRAVVIATHDEAALEATDRVLRLNDGQVVDDEE